VREHWDWRAQSGFDTVSIGDRLGIVGQASNRLMCSVFLFKFFQDDEAATYNLRFC
jgi:hypothetical protein